MNTHTRQDDGAVAVIVAICLVMLFAFAALAVDVGMWFTEKRQLQSAADGAALAGCAALADGKSDVEVWDEVTDYAEKNFTVPVDLGASTVSPPLAGGESDIGDDYVKVTVRTVSPSFFARVIGYDEGRIAAQSVAKIGYLAGARGPVPWGLIILNVSELSGSLGGESVSFWDQGGGVWAGGFSAGHAGPLTINAENSLGYVEPFPAVLTVAALSPTGRIAAVDLEKTTFTSGAPGDSTCDVAVTLSTPLATGGTVKATTTGGAVPLVLDEATGEYKGTVGIPSTSEAFITCPIEIEVKEDHDTEARTARVLVRRSNYILESVEAEPLFALPTQGVSVTVKTLSFTYGDQYALKVEGGAGTTGNFQALNFSSLDHSDCQAPNTPVPNGGNGAADYADYIAGDPNLAIHLNDWVNTETGNMVGPTRAGIEDRLNGAQMLTFAQWVAAGKPDNPQVMVVPILEKPSPTQGRTDLKVITFATFFLEASPQGAQDPVVGRFVEYTSPGWVVVNNPPGPLAVTAVHLVSEHLDF